MMMTLGGKSLKGPPTHAGLYRTILKSFSYHVEKHSFIQVSSGQMLVVNHKIDIPSTNQAKISRISCCFLLFLACRTNIHE